jgi:hypothetical protein
MTQTRRQSLIEAWANIAAGLGLSMLMNALLFPHFGWQITGHQNLMLGGIFTVASLVRSYTLRRLFNRWHR